MSLKGPLASRRGFLVSMTAGALGGLAGCLGDGTDTDPSTTQTDENESSDSGTVVKTAPSEDTPGDTPTETPDGSDDEPLSPPLQAETGTTDYGIELAGSPVITNTSDPPVDIYYWFDYQCEYCKEFEMGNYGTLPKLVQNEVADESARIVLLYYPNYGDQSWTAGVMAKCLWQQVKDDNPDRFWEWHHTVFDNQELAGEDWSSQSSLLGYARDIEGIDADSLDQCMQQNRDQHEEEIKKERKRAQDKEGFSDTPGFVLHHPESDQSTSFFGAQPYSTFEQQINAYDQ